MEDILALAVSPVAWAALATLIAMEIVLGVDNLIFVSILTNKLPAEHRSRGRRIGLGLALILRLGLLGMVAFIAGLTTPVFSVLKQEFSWRDIILIAGGLFLVWKATKEIHHSVDPDHGEDLFPASQGAATFGSTIAQIVLLDIVFSIDSIVTAVGMTLHIPIMVMAVIVAVGVMIWAANPVGDFIHRNPTIVMLALGFLLLIGTTLIAEGFGVHVPKGYIYAAMAFSAFVESLNMAARQRRSKPVNRGETE